MRGTKQGVTTLVMAEKHTKTKSSGVQYQAECCFFFGSDQDELA